MFNKVNMVNGSIIKALSCVYIEHHSFSVTNPVVLGWLQPLNLWQLTISHKGKRKYDLFCPSHTHTVTQYEIHSHICVMDVFPKEIKGKSHDEYPVCSTARVCVHVQVCICMTACKPFKNTVGVKFVLNVCCMPSCVWTVKEMFCILLMSSYPEAKVWVQKQRERGQNGKQTEAKRKGKTFYLCKWRTSLNQLSLQSRLAFHMTIKKREKEGGWVW